MRLLPRSIVKPEKDKDFYVEWSTVVDAPTFYGTRADIIEHSKESDWRHIAEERLERADATGTSARWYKASWEDDEIYILEQTGTFPRSKMFEVVTVYDLYGVEEVLKRGLIDPIVWDDDE